MDIVSIAAGAAGVGVLYFLYLCAARGGPAALAWLRERWGRGRAVVQQLEDDVNALHGRLEELEIVVIDLHKRLAGEPGPGPASGIVAAAEERLPSFLQKAAQ